MGNPTIYNTKTGRWEEISPGESEAEYGIPIGPPTQYSESPSSGGEEGYPNIPSPTEGPSSYWDVPLASTGRKPQLWASTEEGVPQDYSGGGASSAGDQEDINRRMQWQQEDLAIAQQQQKTEQARQAEWQQKTEEELHPPKPGEPPKTPVEKQREAQQMPPSADAANYLPPGFKLKGTPQEQQPAGGTSNYLPPGFTLKPGQPPLPDMDGQLKSREYDVKAYGNLYPSIADRRQRFMDEIDRNPRMREYLAVMVSQEGKGADTIQAVLEALVNRADQRGTTIEHEMTNGFYGPLNSGHIRRLMESRGVEQWQTDQFNTALEAVRNGSNLIEGRTDQGMINEIHGERRQYGSEWFGDMGGDPTWRANFQKNIGEPGKAVRARGQIPGAFAQPGERPYVPPLDSPGVSKDLLGKVSDLQAQSGPLHITSGYRNPKHNAEVGGAQHSQHLIGNAVDIDTSNMSHADQEKLIAAASARGITGIGVYGDSIHFDLGSRRAWGPDHSSGSIPSWAAPVLKAHTQGGIAQTTNGPDDISRFFPPGFTPKQPGAAAKPDDVSQYLEPGMTLKKPAGGQGEAPSVKPSTLEQVSPGDAAHKPGLETLVKPGTEKVGPRFSMPGTYTFGDEKPKGLVEEGNLDIRNRPIVHNKDGTFSTEQSFSVNDNGKEVLLPKVVKGKVLSTEDAIAHYKKTGENLGKFDTPENADTYAEKLHNRPMPLVGPSVEWQYTEKQAPGLKDLPHVSPEVGRMMGFRTWIDIDTGRLVKRAEIAHGGPSDYKDKLATPAESLPIRMRAAHYGAEQGGMPVVQTPKEAAIARAHAGNYETPLPDAVQFDFRAWRRETVPNLKAEEWDLPGAFAAGAKPDPKTGELPDTFKKPDHPTFSTLSKYAYGPNAEKAGHYVGDRYVPTVDQFLNKLGNEGNKVPDFELTPEQKALFEGGKKKLTDDQQKQYIAAHIASESPGVKPTQEQKDWVEKEVRHTLTPVSTSESILRAGTSAAVGTFTTVGKLINELTSMRQPYKQGEALKEKGPTPLGDLMDAVDVLRRKSIEVNPQEYQETRTGALAGGLTKLGVDVATSFILPQDKVVKGLGKAGQIAAAAMSFAPQSAREAGDAADAVKQAGGSRLKQGLAWAETFVKNELLVAAPLHSGSTKASALGRFAERTAKSGLKITGLNLGMEGLEQVEAKLKGEKRPVDLVGLGVTSAAIALLGGAAGEKLMARLKDRDTWSNANMKDIEHNYVFEKKRAAAKEGMDFGELVSNQRAAQEKVEAGSQQARLNTHNDRLVEIDKRLSELQEKGKKGTLSDTEAKEAASLWHEQMSVGEKAAQLEQDIAKGKATNKAAEEARAKNEPLPPEYIDTTREGRTVTHNDTGQKGEVVKEQGRYLDVEWNDGTKSTVHEDRVTRPEITSTKVQNEVSLIPEAKGQVRVVHYDANGKITREAPTTAGKAEARAKELTENKNLTGYYDVNGNYVHERGTHPFEAKPVEKPSEPARPGEPAAPAAPAAGVPVEGTTEAPGITPEQQAAIAASVADRPPQGFFSRMLRIGKKVNSPVDTRDVWERNRHIYNELKKLEPSERTDRLKELVLPNGKTVGQELTNYFVRFGPNIPKIEINHSDVGTKVGVIPDSRNGRIKLIINPAKLYADLKSGYDAVAAREGEAKAKQHLAENWRATLGEELRHAATFHHFWNKWSALPQATRDAYTHNGTLPGVDGFHRFLSEQVQKSTNKMRDFANSLPKDQADAIHQIAINSYNVYADESDAFRGTPEQFWQKLADSPEGAGISFAMEFWRQILQARDGEKITERVMAEASAQISKDYHGWLTSLESSYEELAGRSAKSPNIDTLSQVLHDDLKEIDDLYKRSLEGGLRTYSEIQSGPSETTVGGKRGPSQDIKDFAGQTTVTLNPQTRTYNAVYRINKDATSWGTHLGTQEASYDAHLSKAGPDDQWTPYALYIKLENPAVIRDHTDNGWHPAEVSNDLISRGYVTPQDITQSVNKNGEITEDALKKILLRKGYDGFMYENQVEGKRQLKSSDINKILNDAIYEPQTRTLGKPSNFIAKDKTGRPIGMGDTRSAADANARRNLERDKTPRALDHSYIVFDPRQTMSATGNAGVVGTRTIGAKTRDTRSYEDEIVETHNQTGGSSISPAHGNLKGKDYFAVEVYPEMTKRIDGLQISHQHLFDLRSKALENNIDINTEELFLGTWANKAENYTEIGISAAIPDMRAAMDVGAQYKQDAIFDLATGGEIYLNGAMGDAHLPAISERQGFIGAKSRDPYTYNAKDLPGLPELALSDKGIEKSYRAGEKWSLWYKDWDRFSTEMSKEHPDYRYLLDNFLGATSAHNLVGSNYTAGMKAFKNFVEVGDPSVDFEKFDAHAHNLRRAVGLPVLSKEIPGVQPFPSHQNILSGAKIGEYTPALHRDRHAIAVDVHVGRQLFGVLSSGKDVPLSDAHRIAGQMAIIRVADRLKVDWQDLQAAIFATDIIQGKDRFGNPLKVKGYEDYAKLKREEYFKLVNADVAKGGRGGAIGRELLARASQRIGPERFLRDEARAQAIRKQREEEVLRGTSITPEQARKIALDPYLAARISLTGPKEILGPNGMPVTGAKTRSKDIVQPEDVSTSGRYWLDRNGAMHDVNRGDAIGHRGYAISKMGMDITEAADNGWVRVVTSPGDLQGGSVYWEGRGLNPAQMRTLKDAAANLGFDVERDTAGTVSLYDRAGSFNKAAGMEPIGAKTRPLIPTTAADARISNAADLRWVYEGGKHVLWHSPGLHGLGDDIVKHEDLKRKYSGEFKYPFFEWEREATGVLTGMANAGVQDLARLANVGSLGLYKPRWGGNFGKAKAAVQEHEAYRKAVASGSPLPALSPEARELRDRTDQVVNKINNKNASLNIKIQHPDTKAYVPIPKIDFPAQVREDVLAAMRDPQNHQTVWREWTRALVTDHILPSTATESDFVAHRDKIIESINTNGAFGSFFFFPKTMPKSAFDYSYRSMDQFLDAYTERLAQVEAFGPTRSKDIFTHYKNKTADQGTRDYIGQLQNLAYGDVVQDTFGRMATYGGHVASTMHLGNPLSAMKNLISGMTMNTLSLGVHMPMALLKVNPFRVKMDAVEKGILTRDLMNVMTYGERMSGVLGMRSAGELAFKYSGYNAAENWVRGVAMVGGQSILRHAVDLYKTNPMHKDVLRYMAYLERLGFRGGRAEALLKEGGTGDLTDEYLRSMVTEIQGGYSYSNVPVYMSQPAGKALFKYQKWGAEQARHFDQEVLRPALRGVGVLKRNMVTITDPNNPTKKIQVPVPRSYKDFIPAAAYIVGLGAAGAGMAWALEQSFGTPDKTITLAEALAQYEHEKGWAKYSGFMNKLWGYHMLMGSMGTIGNYIQAGLTWTGLLKSKQQKDITSTITEASTQGIPSLDPFVKIADAIKIAHEQGWYLGWKDVDRIAEGVSFYRANKQMMLTQVGRFQGRGAPYGNDVYGTVHRWSDQLANKQDLSRIKDIESRYQQAIGYDKRKAPPVAPVKSPMSAWREPFDDALSIGDVQKAREIMQVAKRGMPHARWEIEKKNLAEHVRSKQPIQPLGGEGGEKAKPDFNRWANVNLSPFDREMIRRVNQTYVRSARHLLQMDFERPSIEDVKEFRHELKLKQAPTEYPGNLLDPASLFK